MRSPFDRFPESVIRDCVENGWGLAVRELFYLPEGGGAYHWTADTSDGRRFVITCDDLDTKPWLGSARDAVFTALLAAYATAAQLRAGGLAFVVAPLPSGSGAPAVRVDDRHSVSVFPFVDGVPGRWGVPLAEAVRTDLVDLLARLHTTAVDRRGIPRRRLDLPGRVDLDGALGDLGGVWDGGPLSEPARRELVNHASTIAGWLADLDRVAAALGDRESADVVTHGEPHPGNLIVAADGPALVDWDTVAVAPPERDMWMLADDGGATAERYHALTGVTLDNDAVAAYRLLWALADVASFTAQLRGQHQGHTDDQRALVALRSILDGREPSPYGVSRV